jgi:hypothetical protein
VAFVNFAGRYAPFFAAALMARIGDNLIVAKIKDFCGHHFVPVRFCATS